MEALRANKVWTLTLSQKRIRISYAVVKRGGVIIFLGRSEVGVIIFLGRSEVGVIIFLGRREERGGHYIPRP